MSTTLSGASDDLIELDGDLIEEFTYVNDSDGDLVAFSNGLMLRIRYDIDGVWRIWKLAGPDGLVTITQAPVNDENDYTDRAVIAGPVEWAVHGVDWAAQARTGGPDA